ncbi:PSD1 and planctomycete cytochrome C domain-containing protein [Ulvibacterium sp.]|uniref:PSD1 and planctomycete cytochrome C domain-containing protein n=1 Tax=Ulvibacterium sp. TaxID=2665914 RepID=UPI002623EC98|nr:PSD1 and planctomycete cytochrome C domain-containing protein [Ulvibacterium sp.]
MVFSQKRNIVIAIGFVCVLISSCGDNRQFSEPLPETVDFNFHIRPILVQNCYLCHGPDASGRKAELRLDTYEGATAALKEGGHAIVPGKPSKSQLIYRINHEAEDLVMPPPDSNYKLTEREKALLEKWIDQGAEWKPHWAFIKPETGIAPNNSNAIDSLIHMRLRQKGLSKTSKADKNTLIRRVSYLLTGLPPSPEDVKRFVADTSSDAYGSMVDRYLNSKGYGERWARHWMDLVRYAETKGHEFDYPIVGAYKYRDYLIRAFNEDVPYDQLLTEHLAGDLLEESRENKETGISESPLGTAFYVMGEGKHSPVDIKKEEADRIDNMIDVTSKTFQGLTVSCAKCHDHKFDPITAADYYAFYGIMESTRFTPIADVSMTTGQTAKQVQDLNRYMRKIVADSWSEKDLQEITASRESQRQNSPLDAPYTIIGDFRNSGFDRWLTNGLAFGERTTLGNPLVDRTSEKLLGLDKGRASSKTLGTGVFGSLQSPNFILDTDYIGIRARGANSTIRIIIDNFQLIQDPIYGELEQQINSKSWNNYVFDISPWKGHKAYIEILPGGYKGHHYNLPKDAFIEAQYAITYTSEWPVEMKQPIAKPVKKENWATLELSANLVNGLNQRLAEGKLPSEFPQLATALDSSYQLIKNIEGGSFFYGITDGFGINSPVFNRGDHNDLLEGDIPRRFLSALPLGDVPFTSKGSGRLELAETMLSEDNPLTARVMVNRIWHHLFGKGIVETVDNFGLQGKLPSHPELLDYLAITFQKEGWSIKKMVRSIVTSETFKRGTARNEELTNKDPNNIYLASFPVRRLEAEAIRDGVLAVSGSLDSTMYGPPVKTYLTEFMQGRGRPSQSGPMDGAGRRSIYQEVRRNFLEPMMVTFDRPIPFSTFGNRNVTNVPAQSLTLMNDPFIAQQAGIMAEKLLAQKELTFDQKIEWIYMRTFSRKPNPEEIRKAQQFISGLRKMESTETDTDNEILIWKDFCHSIFNLKEFIYLI